VPEYFDRQLDPTSIADCTLMIDVTPEGYKGTPPRQLGAVLSALIQFGVEEVRATPTSLLVFMRIPSDLDHLGLQKLTAKLRNVAQAGERSLTLQDLFRYEDRLTKLQGTVSGSEGFYCTYCDTPIAIALIR
jgi:hypothetical protein